MRNTTTLLPASYTFHPIKTAPRGFESVPSNLPCLNAQNFSAVPPRMYAHVFQSDLSFRPFAAHLSFDMPLQALLAYGGSV